MVRDIPSYREGGDLAKYIRGLEVELQGLAVSRCHWKTILLSCLLRLKDQVFEIVKNRGSYVELKQALLTQVGLSLRELEIELFSSSKKFYKDRVERARQVVALAERVSMLCPRQEDLELFLAKALFA